MPLLFVLYFSWILIVASAATVCIFVNGLAGNSISKWIVSNTAQKGLVGRVGTANEAAVAYRALMNTEKEKLINDMKKE